MISANLSDGTTQHFDLAQPGRLDALLELTTSGVVSGLSIHFDSHTHSLPRPKRFISAPVYGAEILTDRKPPHEQIGESIFVQVDKVRSTISLTYATKHVRHDLELTGRMRYNSQSRKRRSVHAANQSTTRDRTND